MPAAPPLFQLRGFQVVEQARGSADLAGNVALRDWCGFPKNYDQYNEWLILNYMVSRVVFVFAVRAWCKFVRKWFFPYLLS